MMFIKVDLLSIDSPSTVIEKDRVLPWYVHLHNFRNIVLSKTVKIISHF